MIETGSNADTCCITDTGQGRIRWEWHEGHWVRSDSRSSRLATTRSQTREERDQRESKPSAR
jgi:hypothetical protein